MDQPWQIELLGWLRATQGDRVISRFRSRKAEALLARLAYFHQRSHPRQQLMELLWPQCDPAAGQRRLSVELTSLRRQLESPGVPAGAVLVATRTTIQLNPAASVIDVARFEAALQAAARAETSVEQAQLLVAAVQSYRGELLPGCCEDWVLVERQRLAEAFLGAIHRLVALLEQRGDRAGAVQWARRAVAADPLDEESHQRLIRLLLATGQVEAARLQYQQSEQLLLRELGVGFAPDIHRLILDQVPAKQRQHPSPAEKRGERRRAGTQRHRTDPEPDGLAASPGVPEGAGCDTAPPLSSPQQSAGMPTQPSDSLPLRFTRFFGRERELAELERMLLAGADNEADEEDKQITASVSELAGVPRPPVSHRPRLVTLTGPGGTGKTRLAQEVAQRLRYPRAEEEQSRSGKPVSGFPGGIWFVSLRDLPDPALIPDQILLALRLPRDPMREPLEQAATFLSRAPSLLLLDNYEHLVDEGGSIVQELLEKVDGLLVLATSRRRLGLEGEREFSVAPLPVPELAAHAGGMAEHEQDLPTRLLQCESIRLFVDRAQAVRPDFQLTRRNAAAVAALCRRLEGLPLAIELAAARAGVLTPQQMVSRLDQQLDLLVNRQRPADPRHRSLRATMDWSYQLLTPALRQFSARLSIFRGGWTVAAAEAVCEQPGALEALDRLRECSLVQVTEVAAEMRFHLLEMLREYGAEQLSSDERRALAQQHAQFYRELVETTEGQRARADQRRWLDRLEQEHDNLRTALAWSTESGDLELGLRLASSLEGFWVSRGYLKEGRAQLLQLLAHPEVKADTARRAQGLSTAGMLTGLLGDPGAARALHEECLALWRRLADRAGIATALCHLGQVSVSQWRLETARAQVEESLAIRRELGDPQAVAEALTLMAEVCRCGGEAARARPLVEESLALWRGLDDQVRIIRGLERLGFTAIDLRDMDAARSAFGECLTLARELDDRPGVAGAITGLGHVHWVRGDYTSARAFFEEALPLWRELNHNSSIIDTLCYLGMAIRYQGDSCAAYPLLKEMLAIAREANWSNYTARSLVLLGATAGDLGRWEEAAVHCAEGLRLSCSDAHDPQHRHHLAWSLMGLARVALARGRLTRAARLLGAAEPLWYATARRRELDQAVSAVRSRMKVDEFDAAWAEGQANSLDHAITEALEEAPIG